MVKILCIHGYRQNGEVFKQKTGALRTMLKKQTEFSFVTAPNKIPLMESDEQQSTQLSPNHEQYGWWFSNDNCGYDSKKPSEVCIGFKKSLDLIIETVKEKGPFDGLLGFSQGASFVSVLCGMHQMECLPFTFKFAIMISGFRSLCSPHSKYYMKRIRIPSLHVYGATDQIISKERSEELATFFLNAVKVEHKGGHYVAANSEQKKIYSDFLQYGVLEPMVSSDEADENESRSEKGTSEGEEMSENESMSLSEAMSESEETSDSEEMSVSEERGQ